MPIRYFDRHGDELDRITDDPEFPRNTTVRVEGYGGIAWKVDHVSPEDSEWIVCIMVGDDREFSLDRSRLTKLEREEFCGECGQIGCTHDGR